MQDRELQNILSSGEIGNIQIGGTTSNEKVIIKSDLTTMQSNITTLQTNTQGLTNGTAVPASPDPSLRNVHFKTDKPVVCTHPQDLSIYSETEVRAMTEYCTVSNAFMIEDTLKGYVDAGFMPLPTSGIMDLTAANPTFKMGVTTGGIAAQMQVVDKETSRAVATMEWLKSSQTFNFTLNDRNTGLLKNSFELKQDGTAYVNNKQIITADSDLTSYDFVKVSGQSITQDTFKQVAKLTTPIRKSGTYEYKFSVSFKYSSTSRSAVFRISSDNGTNWTEFKKEPKDATDTVPFFYAYPKTMASDGVINLILEAKCENASDTLTVNYCDLIAERKN